MDLGSPRQIARIDKKNMLDLLISFPKQCEDALFVGEHTWIKPAYKRNYSHIIFTGLGGSAIGADIIKNYVGGEISTPIFINRNYTLPKFTNRNSLIFAVSYSGATEESLSAYAEAKKKNAKVAVVTSGGKLKALALQNQDLLVQIPKGYPPRCALGYSFIPALVILAKLGLIEDKSQKIKNAVQLLDKLQKRRIAPGVIGRANVAKDIARRIYNRFPVIYASDETASIATRWRGQLAENAKTLSSTQVFPEMNHNEIVGWMNPRALLAGFTAIILKDKGDHTRVKKRMRITAKILRKEKFDVLEIESQGRTLLERMLSLIYIGDFVSFYLAILNRIDPTPVERITYLKKQLGK